MSPGSGRCLTCMSFVLVPGAGGEGWYWHRVVPLLESAGHRAIAVDLPTGDEGAGLAEYADAIVAAAGDANDVTLVAQSMGGFSAPLAVGRLDVRRIVLRQCDGAEARGDRRRVVGRGRPARRTPRARASRGSRPGGAVRRASSGSSTTCRPRWRPRPEPGASPGRRTGRSASRGHSTLAGGADVGDRRPSRPALPGDPAARLPQGPARHRAHSHRRRAPGGAGQPGRAGRGASPRG